MRVFIFFRECVSWSLSVYLYVLPKLLTRQLPSHFSMVTVFSEEGSCVCCHQIICTQGLGFNLPWLQACVCLLVWQSDSFSSNLAILKDQLSRASCRSFITSISRRFLKILPHKMAIKTTKNTENRWTSSMEPVFELFKIWYFEVSKNSEKKS
jgi:hypothetical protein